MDIAVTKEAISPENLIAGVQLIPPEGIVRVRGRVTALRPYPKGQCVYGDLTSINDAATITFKCPEDAAPDAYGQLAIIEGGVRVANGFKAGFNLEISGSCLGTFLLPEVAKILMPENRRVSVPILELLSENKSYMFLGTNIGVNDAIQAGGVPALEERTSTTNPEIILKNIKRAITQDDVEAVFLLRGGNDSSLKIWDEPEFIRGLLDLNIPFYTALGHSHFISLADQWADQCFRTPDHAGQAISQALKNIESERKLKLKIDNIDKLNNDLEEQLVKKEHQYQLEVMQVKNNFQEDVDKFKHKYNEINSKLKNTNTNLKLCLFGLVIVSGLLASRVYGLI